VIYDPEHQAPAAPSATATTGPTSGLKDAHIQPHSNVSLKEEVTVPRRGSIIDTVTQQAKKISADVQNAMESGRKCILARSYQCALTRRL
jgi:hypothetical protein